MGRRHCRRSKTVRRAIPTKRGREGRGGVVPDLGDLRHAKGRFGGPRCMCQQAGSTPYSLVRVNR